MKSTKKKKEYMNNVLRVLSDSELQVWLIDANIFLISQWHGLCLYLLW